MNCPRFLCLLTILLLTGFVRAAEPGFPGEWETTYGHLSLAEGDGGIHGTYQVPGGAVNEIRGTVAGKILTFTYTEPGVTGEGTFTLEPDGQAFKGQWRVKGAPQWLPWSGRRAGAPGAGFSGVWKSSFGPMRLIEKDGAVSGCYQFNGQAEISGAVKDGVLRFEYTEPDGSQGTGEFRLTHGGASLAGTWKTADGRSGGEWQGDRVRPTAGRSWLVVLEAHWESSLQESEYSYGEMLRQFFTRVPGVSVRHRYFDEKDDFAAWCADLPYINEPAVFYISSHGSEEGITVGRHVLTGEFIGRQLRYAPEIKLVHLGACLSMSGAVPAALRKASGREVPVSGFTRVADWAGSAVIDFSYLDLVLSRGMAPGEAVRQILKNVTFAGESETPDSAIKPAGLKIVE